MIINFKVRKYVNNMWSFDERSGELKSNLVVTGLRSISVLLCYGGNISALGFFMITCDADGGAGKGDRIRISVMPFFASS